MCTIDSLLRVGLGVVVFGDGIGVVLLEDVGELRVAQRVVPDMDAAFGIDDGNDGKDDEQANDGKEDF